MLILTRKPNEAIRVGDHIVVRVLQITGLRVSLAISAPPEVKVWRDEIYREHELSAQNDAMPERL